MILQEQEAEIMMAAIQQECCHRIGWTQFLRYRWVKELSLQGFHYNKFYYKIKHQLGNCYNPSLTNQDCTA